MGWGREEEESEWSWTEIFWASNEERGVAAGESSGLRAIYAIPR